VPQSLCRECNKVFEDGWPKVAFRMCLVWTLIASSTPGFALPANTWDSLDRQLPTGVSPSKCWTDRPRFFTQYDFHRAIQWCFSAALFGRSGLVAVLALRVRLLPDNVRGNSRCEFIHKHHSVMTALTARYCHTAFKLLRRCRHPLRRRPVRTAHSVALQYGGLPGADSSRGSSR